MSNGELLTLYLYDGPPWGFSTSFCNSRIYVNRVAEAGPAKFAGLDQGDQITEVNGSQVWNWSEAQFDNQVNAAHDQLSLTVQRVRRVCTKTVQIRPSYVGAALAPTSSYLANVNIDLTDPDPVLMPISENVQPVSIRRLQRTASPEPTPAILLNKKQYADSSFYGDRTLYPTIEQQKQMAKTVARSLTDRNNFTSKGASMFERRKLRASKWTSSSKKRLDGSVQSLNCNESSFDDQENIEDLEPTCAVPVMYGADLESTVSEDAPLPLPPPPPPPPAPGYPFMVPDRRSSGSGAAQVLSCLQSGPRTKTEREYYEKISAYPRSKHDKVPLETCFQLTKAMHTGSCLGAQMFAKRRNRQLKDEVSAFSETKSDATRQPTVSSPANQNTTKRQIPSKLQTTIRRSSAQLPNRGASIKNGLSEHPASSESPQLTSAVSGRPADSKSSLTWKPVKFNVPTAVNQSTARHVSSVAVPI